MTIYMVVGFTNKVTLRSHLEISRLDEYTI